MSFKQKLKYLDPYFYMDLFIEFLHKKDINYKILDVVIYILYSLILAYLLLKILGLLLGTSDAMMIVVSGSMDPTLKIGDIVVLKAPNNIQTNEIIINKDINKTPLNWFAKINYDLKTIISNNKQITLLDTKSITIDENKYDLKQEGAIIVYYSEIQKRKIIHRAIFKLTANDGNYYLTKGDNEITNTLLDTDCGIDKFGNITKECITALPIPEENVIAKYWFKIPYLGYIKLLPAKVFGFG